jgi:hypothetical protein
MVEGGTLGIAQVVEHCARGADGRIVAGKPAAIK